MIFLDNTLSPVHGAEHLTGFMDLAFMLFILNGA